MSYLAAAFLAVFASCGGTAGAFLLPKTFVAAPQAFSPLPFLSRARSVISGVTLCSSSESSGSAESPSLRNDLFSLLSDANDVSSGLLPAGLECDDRTRDKIQACVEALEGEDDGSNLVRAMGGRVDVKELVGDWALVYTNSNTMVINRGLSGLGRSESDSAKFGSLTQKLRGSKFLANVEYIERIDTGDDESDFDVTVTGEFEVKGGTINALTGGPCAVMRCDLESLSYGMSRNKAAGWASLGPVKMTDIVYLSEGKDLYIARGHVKNDSIFIWRRLN